MAEYPRRRVLALGVVVGSVGTSGCLTAMSAGGDESGDDGTAGTNNADVRSLTLSKSGPGTLADASDVHSGWVHVVAHGETYDVTFDVRISHDRTEEAEVSLRGFPGGEYDLELATSEASETPKLAKPDAGGRQFGTRITGSGTLPIDFESLRVTANGETLRTVENEGTMPVMRPLPDPVEPT